MKTIPFITFFISCLLSSISWAQHKGNILYNRPDFDEENFQSVNLPNNNIRTSFTDNDVIISVKGLYNVKADRYVAIFNLTQVGKSIEEVNTLLDQRIEQVQNKIKDSTKVYVDMISFVPTYEYSEEKKIFSKNSYNEIPTGFELNKNLHIEYQNPEFFNTIMTVCAEAEIYNLIRVDYFSEKMDQVRAELMKKAKALAESKFKDYKSLLEWDINIKYKKQLADKFMIKFPVEMYKSYKAYSSNSLSKKKASNSKRVKKSLTFYYQPITDKEFDFVINPVIVAPVIQVMYEVKIKVNLIKNQQPTKDFYLVSPNGELKKIPTQE